MFLESELNLAAGLQDRHCFPGTILRILGGKIATTTPRLAFSAAITAISSNPTLVCFSSGGCLRKGVAASMLKSHLHATFRSLADSDPSVGHHGGGRESQSSPRSTLAGQLQRSLWAVPNQTGGVEFVSAGHPPVLHHSQRYRASRICHGDSPSECVGRRSISVSPPLS